MTDTTGDTTSRDTDTTRRVSVLEAAQYLGITPDSVRARLRRGTLPGERINGSWFVDIPVSATRDTTERDAQHDASRDSDTTRHDADTTGIVAAKDETIRRLDAEVTYLRTELAERSEELAEERRRSDIIQREAQALQQATLERIPVLSSQVGGDAPTDAPDHAGAPIETTMAADAYTAENAPQAATDATAAWSELTRQLIEELGMTPDAARMAAAQEIGLV